MQKNILISIQIITRLKAIRKNTTFQHFFTRNSSAHKEKNSEYHEESGYPCKKSQIKPEVRIVRESPSVVVSLRLRSVTHGIAVRGRVGEGRSDVRRPVIIVLPIERWSSSFVSQ
jgi:hypothetical protein